MKCENIQTEARTDAAERNFNSQNVALYMAQQMGTGKHLQCRILGSHSGLSKDVYLLAYNALYSGESQPTFRRNMSPPSSELKSKPKIITA
jgi:hypothetical protein